MPDCGAYCATKAATNAYMEILAEENRATAVQFMLVCPPLVNTPLLEQAMATAVELDPAIESWTTALLSEAE